MSWKFPTSHDLDEAHPIVPDCGNRALYHTISSVPGVIFWMDQALVPHFTSENPQYTLLKYNQALGVYLGEWPLFHITP